MRLALLTFIASTYQQLLQHHQLATFAQVWARKVAWFEEPNVRRGGWSGVGTLALTREGAEPLSLFVKKQENHGRKTWLHPLKGEPTFKREFERLQFLAKHQFLAPQVVFYGVEDSGKQRAVLATEALHGFVPLDTLLDTQYLTATAAQKRTLVLTVASEISRFHRLGLMHRALYPKHIFVKQVGNVPEIALIDLEKARFSPFAWYRAFFDLSALNRHASVLSNTQRLRFFKRYMQIAQLAPLSKWLCRCIVRRSQR